jgi:hypothetical protein
VLDLQFRDSAGEGPQAPSKATAETSGLPITPGCLIFGRPIANCLGLDDMEGRPLLIAALNILA